MADNEIEMPELLDQEQRASIIVVEEKVNFKKNKFKKVLISSIYFRI